MCTEDGHYFKEATITENDLFLVYKITRPIFQKIKIPIYPFGHVSHQGEQQDTEVT